MEKSEVQKVLKFIEENIRVTDQTTIEYLDPSGHLDRLKYSHNQIIFGRRGSGKSLLLKSLRSKSEEVCINVNLEDFKDISFPNSIIQVQKSIIEQLLEHSSQKKIGFSFQGWRKKRRLIKVLRSTEEMLSAQLIDPDEFDKTVKQTNGSSVSTKVTGKNSNLEGNIEAEKTNGVETSAQYKINKLNSIKNQLPDTKKILLEVSDILEKNIFLILDDFYFVRKDDQPAFLDYFHRLSKNTPMFLKVATIKHRSRLYTQSGGSFIGMELGHDAQPLNLDYSLGDFKSLVAFMKELLIHINKKVSVNLNYDELITDNAFRFLCLASGGVPRDFFSLFISLGPKLGGDKSITKPNVIEKSIENLSTKKDALRTDAYEEDTLLEHYLKYITDTVIRDRKWNAFLISNRDVVGFSQLNQAIKELVDLRFLHLVDPNISAASSDGTRYSAYMVDIGLFPNANPRGFQQVEPGQKDERHREDKIRSAPKLDLNAFVAYISSLSLQSALEISSAD